MLSLQSRNAIKRDARAKATTAAHLWERAGDLEERREAVQEACSLAGVVYPESKFGTFPEMLRTQAPDWWGRQLKKADRRDLEAHALKQGQVRLYCSDAIFHARQVQKRETRDFLERLQAVCELEDGTRLERELFELVKGSNANPAVRRAELMTRIRGFEEYAKRRTDVAWFFTFTCPSRFHRNSGDRWKGATPRDAQAYLCEVWARARAAVARKGIEFYGFRIAEPHKDACPHWHCLFWFKSHHDARRAAALFRRYFLADSPNEPGAKRRRMTFEVINAKRGSATGYVAKYICKNVDGIFDDDGLEQSFEDQRRNEAGELEKTGLNSAEAALRVEAWASCWGIRQFQQIGGPRVGVWRELRRLGEGDAGAIKDDAAPAIAEQMRQAATGGQWDLFAELDDAHRKQFNDRARVWAETSAEKLRAVLGVIEGPIAPQDWERADADKVRACLNAWHEPTLREVKGVRIGWARIRSRFLKWVMVLKQATEAKSKAAAFLQEMAAFRSRILEAREEAGAEWGWVEAAGAAPPGPLEFYQ